MQTLHGSGYWAISAEQAMKLTRALKNVARHYPILADERSRDWYFLIGAVATIEGPKLLGLRKHREAATAPAAPPAPVIAPTIDLWAGIAPTAEAPGRVM